MELLNFDRNGNTVQSQLLFLTYSHMFEYKLLMNEGFGTISRILFWIFPSFDFLSLCRKITKTVNNNWLLLLLEMVVLERGAAYIIMWLFVVPK